MTPYPWYKKINPLWWFGNANDPVDKINPDGTPKHENFYPKKPLWIRKILWGVRNPLHNFFFFVIGFEDRPEVVNPGKIWPKEGQKWNIVMPFISYQGKKKEFYLGWRSGIRFGAAFRNVDSKPM
jgi:hypothetical protein